MLRHATPLRLMQSHSAPHYATASHASPRLAPPSQAKSLRTTLRHAEPCFATLRLATPLCPMHGHSAPRYVALRHGARYQRDISHFRVFSSSSFQSVARQRDLIQRQANPFKETCSSTVHCCRHYPLGSKYLVQQHKILPDFFITSPGSLILRNNNENWLK